MTVPPSTSLTERQRWFALILLCLGELMIVLDTTIVNVALPSIRADLGFSDTSLVWVVNAYMLTFGGFLMLGGRLGDLYGQRRLFLAGIAVFTLASLACGVAGSQSVLIIARAVQGVGGAVVSAVALSLIMTMFTRPAERARAMGVYGFVCAGGGSIGVLLGGVLTSVLSWHWIFLVNVPVGVALYLATRRILPGDAGAAKGQSLDVGGAVTLTGALMLAVYAIVNGNQVGWTSLQTAVQLGAAAVLLALFFWLQARVVVPLVPLALLRLRSLAIANLIAVLWAAALFAWFFLSALSMQGVLGYTPLQVGLAFLPSNLIMAGLSLGVSAWLVLRFGIRSTLAAGLLCAAAGLVLFALAPEQGSFALHVLPGMLLLGIGGGIAFNPLLLAAMGDVQADDSGLASGMVNTAFMMGGALGLAVLASIADARSAHWLATGSAMPTALHAGYQWAFAAAAVAALVAAGLGRFALRGTPSAQPAAAEEISHPPSQRRDLL